MMKSKGTSLLLLFGALIALAAEHLTNQIEKNSEELSHECFARGRYESMTGECFATSTIPHSIIMLGEKSPFRSHPLDVTEVCSGHGTCENNTCTCNYGYYSVLTSTCSSGVCEGCQSLCNGTYINETLVPTCIPDRTFYVAGGSKIIDPENAKEYESVLEMTAELLNNKTAEWFGNETANVRLVTKWFQADCSSEGGSVAFNDATTWAEDNGAELSAFIGMDCSSASMEFSTRSIAPVIPQLSYASTNSKLSNKDNYPYFGR